MGMCTTDVGASQNGKWSPSRRWWFRYPYGMRNQGRCGTQLAVGDANALTLDTGRDLSLWEDPGVLVRCNAWEGVPLMPTEYAVVYSWVVWRGVCPPPSLPFGGGQFDLRRRTLSDGVRDSAVGQASTVTPWMVVNNNS